MDIILKLIKKIFEGCIKGWKEKKIIYIPFGFNQDNKQNINIILEKKIIKGGIKIFSDFITVRFKLNKNKSTLLVQ